MTQGSKLIPIANINAVNRLRDLDPAWVATLAASMEERGLDQPIVVRPTEHADFFELVMGGHRLQAAHDLGWTAIPATVRPLDDDQARIAEIDENLMRRELNQLDRAVFLRERKEVYQRLHPETGHGKAGKAKSHTVRLNPQRFTSEVADKIGLGERTVQLAIEIATNLDPETIRQLRGTAWADNRNVLMTLCKETAPRQRALVHQHRESGARTLDEARTRAGFQTAPLPTEIDLQGSILADLMEAWVKASPKTRQDFLAEIKRADEAQAKKGAAK